MLVSNEAGVCWARPEEAPADAPPFTVTNDAIAALRSAATDGRTLGCAAVYEGGAYVVKAIDVATDGTAQMWTPPHGGHTGTKATDDRWTPPHGGHTGTK